MGVDYKIIGGDGQEYGPASLTELSEWIEQGRVGRETYVWRSDENRWIPAAKRAELRWDFPEPETPPELPSAPTVRPAGFWVRFAAYTIDVMTLQSVLYLLLMPWRTQILEAEKLSDQQMGQIWTNLFSNPDAVPPPNETLPPMMVLFAVLVVYAILSLAYYVGFNGRFGYTPGKFLMGLKIVNADGSDIDYRRAFQRYAAELVSALTLGIGYLWIAYSPTKQGLHDLIAHTRVIYRPQPNFDFEG